MESKQFEQKQVHLYLPSPNLKFSNQLLMSKMTVPHATNISLQNSRIQRCHDLKKKKDTQIVHHNNTKNRDFTSFKFSDKGITISVGNSFKKIYGNL